MKTIGIKLADGSFYPVLNEGTPSERLLELTTAHNNQTKVMVDLYRSALGSMEDAEYVDSLQIENLVEHPNGEPTLTFTVSIDENNKLSAKMVDNETGLQSNATITLVSRTLEERLLPDEYAIKDPTLDGVSLTQTEENSLFGNDDDAPSAADQSLDFNFEPELPDFNAPAQEPDATQPEDSSAQITEPDVINEFDAPVDETAVDEIPPEEPPADADDFSDASEPPVTSEAADDVDLPPISDFNPLDEPILEEDALSIDEFNSEPENSDISLPEPDLSFDIGEDNMQKSQDETEESADASSDLPDLDFSAPEASFSDGFDFSSDSSEDSDLNKTNTEDEDLNLDLDLPDFDAPSSADSSLDFDTTSSFSQNYDLDLDSNSDENADFSQDTSYLDDLDFDDAETGTASSSGKGLSFTGLYDKETEMGNSAANSEEPEHKGSKGAVIICVLCAIICVLATAFVLMLIPSKFNLFGNKKSVQTEVAVTELPPEKPAPTPIFAEPKPEPEPMPAPEPLPPVPQAQEEEVVIIENAEDVIPLPPPVTPVKPKDINYKIKWGDTLWDISDTYYKNPWRYKYIARYNGIQNPDYIISGTYITIPAE